MCHSMSARTCHLCGKTLSRMRVGTDGEFCSREHRNQYRLRRSMDQLQEANVMASLLRRREQFKSLGSRPVPGCRQDRRLASLPGLSGGSGPAPPKPVMLVWRLAASLAPTGGLRSMPGRRGARSFPLTAPPAEPRSFAVKGQASRTPLLRPNAFARPPAAGQALARPRSLVAPAPGVLLRAFASRRFTARPVALRASGSLPSLPPRSAPQLRPLAIARRGAAGQPHCAVVRFMPQDLPIGYSDREGETE
jgi:hypothetical protein